MSHFLAGIVWLAQSGDKPRGSSDTTSLIFMLVAIFFFLYLIVLRPQKREREERQKRLGGIKKGDRIVSIGGIHGKVIEAADGQPVLTVEIAPKIAIKINRSAVATVDAKSSAKPEGKEPADSH
ncbi:preprotein translocase subunit YajC [Candidatus Sumerlaeota bacterium]|nr:preprotein translocase subunit YajC [Candidatus Sumerlaeota bacterium]